MEFMLFGYDNLIKDFRRLVDEKSLSHAYLFFGEPQVGKFLFAKSLANYIETKNFDEPSSPLTETLVVDFGSEKNDEGKESVGIERVREIERFLYQTPVSSLYRVAIIRDAEWLTDTAQNALLKILEEPPKSGLIIATARDSSVFLPTVASRMQGIYFRTLPSGMILDFLAKYGRITAQESEKASQGSFGRIGRAVAIIESPDSQEKAFNTVKKALSKSCSGKAELEGIVDELLKLMDKSPLFLESFFEEILSRIKPKFLDHPRECREVIQEIARMESLTLSKRIHLKNILWKTRFILSGSS